MSDQTTTTGDGSGSDPDPSPATESEHEAADAGSHGEPTDGPESGPESGPADVGTGDVPGDPSEFTPDQIDALVAERDQFLDAYRRTAADFDNFRKQSQKRIADEVARATGGFVERLLPVLDAVEAARAHGSEDVEAVAAALFGLLEKEGLESVHPLNEAFDPTTAEAVMHEPGDGEPTVVDVLRTGYVWNGRVIRAAMVKVAG